ncbi:MAG: hypothetical protein ACPGLV_03020 [Bacteroidia bacterium]
MKSFSALLLFIMFIFIACNPDDITDEPIENEPEIHLSANINGSAFKADKFDVSTAISNETTYQITATQDTQTITLFFYEKPQVKTYTITGDISLDKVSFSWASNNLYSTSNHKSTSGTIKISAYENGYLTGTFSGVVAKNIDQNVTASITNGSYYARFSE